MAERRLVVVHKADGKVSGRRFKGIGGWMKNNAKTCEARHLTLENEEMAFIVTFFEYVKKKYGLWPQLFQSLGK